MRSLLHKNVYWSKLSFLLFNLDFWASSLETTSEKCLIIRWWRCVAEWVAAASKLLANMVYYYKGMGLSMVGEPLAPFSFSNLLPWFHDIIISCSIIACLMNIISMHVHTLVPIIQVLQINHSMREYSTMCSLQCYSHSCLNLLSHSWTPGLIPEYLASFPSNFLAPL